MILWLCSIGLIQVALETILGDFIFRAKMIFLMRSMEQWRYAINSSAISPKKEINGNPISSKLAVYANTNPIFKKKIINLQ